MQNEQFDQSIQSTLDAARSMLIRKSSGYSTSEDRLHNFRTVAALNGSTMEQALWGMLSKHIVSLRDMVQSNHSFASDVWDEKIGDAINYLAILKAITVENDPPSSAPNVHVNEFKHSMELPPQPGPTDRDIDAIKRVAKNYK